MLAIVPLMLGKNSNPVYLSFRFFRMMRIQRILDRLDEFSDRFKDAYVTKQILIDNLNMAIKTVFIIAFVVHGLACIYIFIGLIAIQFEYEYYENWIDRYFDQGYSNWEIYATSLIFTTNTVTTIGYGDKYSLTNMEKLYTFLLIYLGMIVFAMLR